MDWYIPITILPGIGLLIVSTTAQMMGLSTEIGNMISGNCTAFEHRVSEYKIQQLTRLTRATACLYIAAACFVLAGILGAVLPEDMDINHRVPKFVLLGGVMTTLAALALLIQYGVKTISIRRMQHQHSHNPEDNDQHHAHNV